jgi:proteasome accessory factor B
LPDTSPILRQWSLLVALSSRRQGMTIREMAAEAGVTQRTVHRDLAALQRVGFPLNESVSNHGRKHWKLGDGSPAIPLSFTWDEAIALYLARRHLEPLAGTQLWDGAQRAFAKIRATLGESALRYLEKMSGGFHQTTVGAGDYAEKGKLIDQLTLAIEDRCITWMTYQSMQSTEPVSYEIYPYGLVFHRNSLYLVARSTSHEETRLFKIDRISGVDVQPLKFTRPADFNLRQHFADSFGVYRGNGQPQRIRIRFTPEVARYVEESRWHKSQQLHRQRDGHLLFEVTLGDTAEIAKWILSFGANAVVLEPKRLAGEICDEAKRIVNGYKGTSRKLKSN